MVASDCSSVMSANFKGVSLGFFGATTGADGGAIAFEDSTRVASGERDCGCVAKRLRANVCK